MTDKDASSGRRPAVTKEQYVQGVLNGDRSLLARAITLVESHATDHRKLAADVLTDLLPKRKQSLRVGVSGVPGSGKSTFIENLGSRLTAAGHRVAVLAVDPSSSVTGGSILGDKTRMEKLAADANAFIRPSPSGGALGGVARKTRESIVLFEAAGYDVILVETVGVGQSEIQVRSMVDVFLLFALAGAGDELQGIKKGVAEIADVVIINKADGKGIAAAELSRLEAERALHYLRPATAGWTTKALTCSAVTGEGVAEVWQLVEEFANATRASNVFSKRRRNQETSWMNELVSEGLAMGFDQHPGVASLRKELEAQVAAGKIPAAAAAEQLLELFLG